MSRKRTRRAAAARREYQRAAPLEPAATINRKLGGPSVVAAITKTAYTAPYRWQMPRARGGTGGLIPQRHHVPLLRYARSMRIRLFKTDFFPAGT